MAKPGPKPAPTATKVLNGVRKGRINDAEPRPGPLKAIPPATLDPVARAEWNRIAPMLERMGVLTEADGPALAMYCEAFARAAAAERSIQKQGLMVMTGLGGMKVNPHFAVAERARALMLKVMGEFGMTPSSRSRIAVETPGEVNQLDAFLAG
jgi:P27 family predicted phage terminase small subunit